GTREREALSTRLVGIGLAYQRDQRQLRVAVQRRRERLDDGRRHRLQRGAPAREEEVLHDLDPTLLDADVAAVGTAVFVAAPVEGLGLVGAEVARIHDPIAVVVELRTAVGVLEPVDVLGLARHTSYASVNP